jgi:PP-loop superfamily ATP-utilizing enzyme
LQNLYLISDIKRRLIRWVFVLCDGTNASDETAGQPGMKALEEFGVSSLP